MKRSNHNVHPDSRGQLLASRNCRRLTHKQAIAYDYYVQWGRLLCFRPVIVKIAGAMIADCRPMWRREQPGKMFGFTVTLKLCPKCGCPSVDEKMKACLSCDWQDRPEAKPISE